MTQAAFPPPTNLGMDIDEAITMLHKLGYAPHRSRTGHPEWIRVFLVKDGVTYGRFSFHHERLLHTKWYVQGANFETRYLHPDERDPIRWRWLVETGEVLDTKTIYEFEREALRRAQAKYDEVIEQRRILDAGRGEPKQRKRPTLPTSRRFLGAVIFEALQARQAEVDKIRQGLPKGSE